MANASIQKQSLTISQWKGRKALLAGVALALVGGYPAGMLLNILSGKGANCVELFDISSCSFPNPLVYYIGLIYALPFFLGVFHFGFTDKKRWWYYVIAALFAKFLYVGKDSLIYEIVAIGGGALVGLAISAWRSRNKVASV